MPPRQQAGPLPKQPLEISQNVAFAADDPSSPESSLYRLSSWAEGLCGPPDQAVAKLWRGRLSIEKIIAPTHSRMSNRDGLEPRELGRRFARTWLTSRVKPSHAHKLEKLEKAEKINFGGLLTYLEMAITLVPSLTAARLCAVWELPEPIWAREPDPEMQPLADAPATPKADDAPATPKAEAPATPKDQKMSRYEAPPPESEPEPAPILAEPMEWSMSRSFKLCKMSEEKIFRRKGVELLSRDITSVRAGVDFMNHKSSKATCVICYSEANGYYYCLYSKGERRAALGILGIDEPCGFLSVSIREGYNLTNAAERGQVSDPYATCRVGREEFRTATIVDNPLHPVWNSDDFQFQVNLQEHGKRTVFIEVFDENVNEGGLDKSLGSAEIDLRQLETRSKHKQLLALVNGGVGQVEVELEFVEKTEYGSNVAPGTLAAKARPRHRRQKPKWTILEQELIYDEEISAFLSTIKPGSQSSSCPPQGYQAKLHAYIHGGFEEKDGRAKVCPHCANYFCWGSFCATCGSIRPGREEQAKEAVTKFGSSRARFDSQDGMKAILDMTTPSEAPGRPQRLDTLISEGMGLPNNEVELVEEPRSTANSPAIGTFPDTRKGSKLGNETKLDSVGRISISVVPPP